VGISRMGISRAVTGYVMVGRAVIKPHDDDRL
jgi:hypothetical protein